MRVDNNGRPNLRKPRLPSAGTLNRVGDRISVPKDYIDPIEYAQKALREDYARRLAQYQQKRGAK